LTHFAHLRGKEPPDGAAARRVRSLFLSLKT